MSKPNAIKSPHRTQSFWNNQKARYVVQFGFAAFIGFVVLRAAIAGEAPGSVIPSAEAYCPMGGFESLYLYITSGGQFVAHTHASNMILFIGIVLTAVFANSFFCGWICPLGSIQQSITGIRRWVEKRVPALQKVSHSLSTQMERVAFLDRWLRYAKYLVLLWIIWGTITYGVMVFRDVDPWAALITIAEPERNLGFIVLIGLLIAAIFGERIWCRYLCPLGAINGLIGKISPIKVQREGSACIGCGRCTKSCPMDLKVDKMTRVSATECTMCLACVDNCPVPGALELKLALPGLQSESPERVGKTN